MTYDVKGATRRQTSEGKPAQSMQEIQKRLTAEASEFARMVYEQQTSDSVTTTAKSKQKVRKTA